EGRSRVGRLVDRGFSWLEEVYGRSLRRALRWAGVVLAGGALLFVVSLLVMRALPREFVPPQDQSRLMVRLQTAVGSDLSETNRLYQRAEEFLLSRPEVERIFGTVGGWGGNVNSGFLFVTLVPPGERQLGQRDFMSLLRRELNAIPGLRAVIQDPSQQGFTAQRGFPVEFSVRGSDWDQLIEVSQEVMAKLRETGTVVDLDTDYQLGMPELRVFPDRARAADLGVSVEHVAATLNALVGGVRVGKYSTGGRRVDVRMRLLADQRARPEDLSRLRVRTRGAELVPLSSLVTTEEKPALQAIYRRDRERAITVYANVAPGASQDKALAAVQALSRDMPLGTRLVLGGASVEFQRSFASLLFALFLGI
ncbi:MAG TPA: efflux RND transporter permease subunit, partial [Thermoanaerobaculia bacterium]|nr:efflux RND transporter permease subunit [Thermoanaerobaculia bacterium]